MWNFETNLSKHHSQILKNKNIQTRHPKNKKNNKKNKHIFHYILKKKNSNKNVVKPCCQHLFFSQTPKKKNISPNAIPHSPYPVAPVGSEAPWPVEHRFRQLWATAWLPSIGVVTLRTGSGGGLGGGLVWLQTRWNLGAQVGVFGLIRWKTTTLRLICNIQSWWNSSFDQSFWLSPWKWCGFFLWEKHLEMSNFQSKQNWNNFPESVFHVKLRATEEMKLSRCGKIAWQNVAQFFPRRQHWRHYRTKNQIREVFCR